MAFTTPTTTRLTPSGGGWLWMDLDAATQTVATAYWPSGGDGTQTATQAAADPGEVWVTFYGIQIVTSPTVDTTVTIMEYDGTTSRFVFIVDATAAAGAFIFPLEAGLPANPGTAITSAVGFINDGVAIPGFSAKVSDETPDDLKVRIWYRPETRGPA